MHLELLQDLQQCTRGVLTHEYDESRLVRTRSDRRLGRLGDLDETSDRPRIVLNLVGDLLEAIHLTGDARAHCGVIPRVRTRNLLRRTSCRTGFGDGRVLQPGQHLATLRSRVTVREHTANVLDLRSRPDVQPKGNLDKDLAANHQRRAGDEFIERRGDTSLDRVLDGHHCPVDLAAPHSSERADHRGVGLCLIPRDLEKSLMRECPWRTEISEHDDTLPTDSRLGIAQIKFDAAAPSVSTGFPAAPWTDPRQRARDRLRKRKKPPKYTKMCSTEVVCAQSGTETSVLCSDARRDSVSSWQKACCCSSWARSPCSWVQRSAPR